MTADQARLVDELTTLVTQLLDQVDVEERIDFTPGRDAYPTGSLPAAMRGILHRHRGPGLLVQLGMIEISTGPNDGPTGGSGTHSQPPPGMQQLLELDHLERRISDACQVLAAAADNGGARVAATSTAGRLGRIIALATDERTPLHATDQAVRALRAVTATAKIALTYDVPWIRLPDSWCPPGMGGCGSRTLYVRADATPPARCIGSHYSGPLREGQIDTGGTWAAGTGRRCGAVWPRATWIQILDQLTQETSS